MCVGGGHGKSPIQILRDKAAKEAAKKATTVTGPDGKTKFVGDGSVVAGVQGNTAGSGVYAERASGAAPERSVNPLFGGLLSILGIGQTKGQKITDPNAVGAGRIGRAFGASDLRIGR